MIGPEFNKNCCLPFFLLHLCTRVPKFSWMNPLNDSYTSDYSFSFCLILHLLSLSSILFYHPMVPDIYMLIIPLSVLEFSFQNILDRANFLLKIFNDSHLTTEKSKFLSKTCTYFLISFPTTLPVEATFQLRHDIISLKTPFSSSPGRNIWFLDTQLKCPLL